MTRINVFLTIKFANFQTNSVSKSHRKKHITLFNVVTISECLVEKQKYIYSLQALTSSIRCNLSNCDRSHAATWRGLNMKTYWVSQVVNCCGKFEENPYLILRGKEDCTLEFAWTEYSNYLAVKAWPVTGASHINMTTPGLAISCL